MSVGLVHTGRRTVIWQVTAGALSSNSYVCAVGQQCAVIDPGLDVEPIQALIDRQSLVPVAIFCTHGHFDHVGSASTLQQKYRIPVYLHGDDVKVMKMSNFLMMALKIPGQIDIPEVTAVSFDRGDICYMDETFQYLLVPGHTPGSCLITVGDAVFSGDTIYASGVGLSKLPGGDEARLRSSLGHIIDALPADRTILPGHGPCASLSQIMAENLQLRTFLGRQAYSGGSF